MGYDNSTSYNESCSRKNQHAESVQVYREGNAVRLEFASPGNAREVLPLWADDRDVAAEIVRLMPVGEYTVWALIRTAQGTGAYRLW